MYVILNNIALHSKPGQRLGLSKFVVEVANPEVGNAFSIDNMALKFFAHLP